MTQKHHVGEFAVAIRRQFLKQFHWQRAAGHGRQRGRTAGAMQGHPNEFVHLPGRFLYSQGRGCIAATEFVSQNEIEVLE